jgi:hypothetical protein
MSKKDWSDTEWDNFNVKERDLFLDIILRINMSIRQATRKFGTKKNVLPSKIVLPKEDIQRLLAYRPFRIVWDKKPIYRRLVNEFWTESTDEWPTPYKWIRIETYPNIGGIRVEEGKELKVEVYETPRRRRTKVD